LSTIECIHNTCTIPYYNYCQKSSGAFINVRFETPKLGDLNTAQFQQWRYNPAFRSGFCDKHESSFNKIMHLEEDITMKRWLAYTILISAVFILANAFCPQLEAQRNYDRQNQMQNQDQVCFYTDENYQGDSFCASPGQSMRNIGKRFNDRISSIRIPRRLEVTIFDDENFGGGRQTYSQDVANLGSWNDRFTSFKISVESRSGGFDSNRRNDGYDPGRRGGGFDSNKRANEPRDGACFYTEEDFRGRSFCLDSGQSERSVGGRFSDRISSIRVFGRARVTVFSDENFRGRGRSFSHDVGNLRNLNDKISSIQMK
jgi:hypothetical protein